MKKVHTSSPLNDSIYEDAIDYFNQLPEIEKMRSASNQALMDAHQKLLDNTKQQNIKQLNKKVTYYTEVIKNYDTELEERRLTRLHKVKSICDEILSLCQDHNIND